LNVAELYEMKFPMFTGSGNLVFLTKRYINGTDRISKWFSSKRNNW